MKTFVISAITGVIMMGIGGGLVYDSLSRDLLGCRLNVQRTAIQLSTTEEDLEKYRLKEKQLKEYLSVEEIIEYYSQE